MATPKALAGRAVVVTGGGSGIGRETARQFADAGADVLVVGRRCAHLQETAVGYQSIRTLTADITDPAGPTRVVTAASELFGRIDVLVNNAAITRPAVLGEIDPELASSQIATNLTAPLLLAQEALPQLVASRGLIINVTSNPPLRGWPRNAVYGATKVALDFLTFTWAVELAEHGVRVVSVAPGTTETPALRDAYSDLTSDELAARARVGRIPLARRAQPAEIAWWIVNAARPEASYLTGAVLRVDGGASVA